MNIGIDSSFYLNYFLGGADDSGDDGEFGSMLNAILSGSVIVSPKIENRLFGESELAQETRKKLNEKLSEMGGELEHNILLINKTGEISRYDLSKKRDITSPTADELKAVARARARKKARLDAYFHLLEKISIKRKLIEQENAKRFLNKKYRFSSTQLDSTARAYRITVPPTNPDYCF